MKAVNRTTWLIVQDRVDELVFHVELAPLVDLEQILAMTIEQLREHDWIIEGTPSLAGFFCNREGERWFVHIVDYKPIGDATSTLSLACEARTGEGRPSA